MCYYWDICDRFPNNHVDLTYKAMSCIALNMAAKNINRASITTTMAPWGPYTTLRQSFRRHSTSSVVTSNAVPAFKKVICLRSLQATARNMTAMHRVPKRAPTSTVVR
jgi:hypothetical protein